MKTKPILLVIVTLIIGFVLGMLTSAQLRMHKLKPVRVYFSEERFWEGFYKIIEPDDRQKEEIEKILQKYAKINGEFQSDFRKQLEANMKDFRKEIDSKLTKEQLARLKEMDERRQEMIRQGWRDRDTSNRDGARRFDRNRGRYPGSQPPPAMERPMPDGRPMPPDNRQSMPIGDSVPSSDGE
jgi:hypothetical protein